MPTHRLIDPLSMDSEAQVLMTQSLALMEKQDLLAWPKDYICKQDTPKKDATVLLKLKHSLYPIFTDNDDLSHYEVIDDSDSGLCGEGKQGQVRRLQGRLQLESDSWVFYPYPKEDPWVVKIIELGKKGGIERRFKARQYIAQCEQEGLSQAGQLAVKNMTETKSCDGSYVAYVTCQRAPGITLSEFLQQKNISALLRCQVSLSLFETATRVLINNNLVHQDLKPDNIFVDTAVSPPRITFIDFGTSAALSEFTQRKGMKFGTGYYDAPEKYWGLSPKYKNDYKLSKRADGFSLGRIVSQLWNNKFFEKYGIQLGSQMQATPDTLKVDLFSGIEIDDECQQLIKKIIIGSTQHRPNERWPEQRVISELKTACVWLSEEDHTLKQQARALLNESIKTPQTKVLYLSLCSEKYKTLSLSAILKKFLTVDDSCSRYQPGFFAMEEGRVVAQLKVLAGIRTMQSSERVLPDLPEDTIDLKLYPKHLEM